LHVQVGGDGHGAFHVEGRADDEEGVEVLGHGRFSRILQVFQGVGGSGLAQNGFRRHAVRQRILRRNIGLGGFAGAALPAGEDQVTHGSGLVQANGVVDALAQDRRRPLTKYRRAQHNRRVCRTCFVYAGVGIHLPRSRGHYPADQE